MGEKKPEKIRASTGFEPVTLANTDAMLYQLSYEATHWEYLVIWTQQDMNPTRNKLTLLPMCGFIHVAQMVEYHTGIAEVMGLNPVEALTFSGFFFPIA